MSIKRCFVSTSLAFFIAFGGFTCLAQTFDFNTADSAITYKGVQVYKSRKLVKRTDPIYSIFSKDTIIYQVEYTDEYKTMKEYEDRYATTATTTTDLIGTYISTTDKTVTITIGTFNSIDCRIITMPLGGVIRWRMSTLPSVSWYPAGTVFDERVTFIPEGTVTSYDYEIINAFELQVSDFIGRGIYYTFNSPNDNSIRGTWLIREVNAHETNGSSTGWKSLYDAQSPSRRVLFVMSAANTNY